MHAGFLTLYVTSLNNPIVPSSEGIMQPCLPSPQVNVTALKWTIESDVKQVWLYFAHAHVLFYVQRRL